MTTRNIILTVQSAQMANTTSSLWPCTQSQQNSPGLVLLRLILTKDSLDSTGVCNQVGAAFRNAYQTDPTEVLPTRISAVGTGYKTLGFSIWSFSYIHSAPAANREVSVKWLVPVLLLLLTGLQGDKHQQGVGWAGRLLCIIQTHPQRRAKTTWLLSTE